jgi:hypothetical protein
VAAASDLSGRAVLVWSSETEDGSGTGVFGRLYDAAGTPGAEFQANSYTTGAQTQPSVAFDADGSFVVVWHGSDDGQGYGVFARCYDTTGAPQGGAFQANSYTTLHQTRPAVAAAGEGRFVVVWQSRQDGDGYGVFGQRYSACGLRQGGEFQVNSHTTLNQTSPSLAANAHGRLVVAWHSQVPVGGYDVFARLYDAAGTPGGEFRVNGHTTGDQRVPSVASEPGGNFVVVWTGPDGVGGPASWVSASHRKSTSKTVSSRATCLPGPRARPEAATSTCTPRRP